MSTKPIGSTFVQLCIDDSLNRLMDGCRVVLEGPVGDSDVYPPGEGPTAELNRMIEVKDERSIDLLFGEGSVLAESLKTAISCCRSSAISLFAVAREDYGTNAVYQLEFDAPPTGVTTRGRLDIFIADERYSTSVSVYEGQTAQEVAQAVAAALNQTPGLPFVATLSETLGRTVVLTAVNGGNYGNDTSILVNWHDRTDLLPEGLTWVLSRTTPGAGAAQKYTDYQSIVGDCCACCWAVLSDDAQFQDGAYEYIESTWDCSKPMCMTIGYTYNSGTVGQILASDTNAKYMARLAHCNPDPEDPTTGDYIAPWLKVAAYATLSCCDTVANPETSIEGMSWGMLRCLQGPGSCFECFSFDDKQELIAAGFVTTSLVSPSPGQLTRPYINNDVTNNRYDSEGRENLTYRDMVSLRLIKMTSLRLTEELAQYQGLALFTRSTSVRAGTRGTSPKIMLGKLRAWAKSQIGVLFSEFENLDEQLIIMTEEETMPACYGDPRRILLQMTYTPPLRVRDIQVNIAPKFRQSCN